MTTTIAIAGKGGVGKTTIAALLIKLLAEKRVVLAIDGDPATNLNFSLGLELNDTVGRVREDMAAEVKSGRFSPTVSKPDYLEMKVAEALVESQGLDLLAMGRPEGPGCYCAANNMLRTCIDRLARNYDFVVMDCEAGMEHISRQTTQDVDILLIVSDPTIRGVTTAARMKELIAEIRTRATKVYLVINRARDGLSAQVSKVIEDSSLELIATIPEDASIMELEERGVPLTQLPEDSPLKQAVGNIASKLGLSR